MSGSTPAELRARVIDQARKQPSPTSAQVVARRRIVIAGVLAVTLLAFIGLGGVRPGPRPGELVLETALGSSVLAIGIAFIGLDRGRSMLGRPRLHLIALVLLAPILLLTWRVFVSSRYPDMMAAWPERPGVRCLFLSGALSLAPLLGLLWLRRGSDPVHPRATAAALGATAGSGAWVLVDAWCPVSYVPHLLLGHVLPLLLTVLGSAFLGSRIVRLAQTKRHGGR